MNNFTKPKNPLNLVLELERILREHPGERAIFSKKIGEKRVYFSFEISKNPFVYTENIPPGANIYNGGQIYLRSEEYAISFNKWEKVQGNPIIEFSDAELVKVDELTVRNYEKVANSDAVIIAAGTEALRTYYDLYDHFSRKKKIKEEIYTD